MVSLRMPRSRPSRIFALMGSPGSGNASRFSVRWPLTQKTQRLLHMCPSWISICRSGSTRLLLGLGSFSVSRAVRRRRRRPQPPLDEAQERRGGAGRAQRDEVVDFLEGLEAMDGAGLEEGEVAGPRL